MLEDVVKSALTVLISQGGGWVVAVLLIVAIVFMVRKNDKLQGELQAQFDKRLEEFKLIVDALNRAADSALALKVSVDARTDAFNKLTGGFADLVRDLEHNRERWGDRGDTWSRQLEDLRSRIEDIQRRLQ